MAQLSPEQQAMKDSIRKSAIIWGVILGIIAGGIAYWALGSQTAAIRTGGAAGIGLVVLALIIPWRIKANSAAARCAKCGAAFSISRTGHDEKVLSSDAKETREAQPDHSTKVTTWTEEIIEVTDTYTCAKCGDITTKTSKRTVKKDEKEEIEPAPIKDKKTAKEKAPEGEGWFSEPTAKESTAKTAKPPAPSVATSTKGKPKK